MAWIRQLPSGLWAATVYTPAGRKTESHELRSAIKRWADEQERRVDQGDWIDPKAGKLTVAECWERFAAGRRLEKASRKRDESHWRVHVKPKWGRTSVAAILKPDVSAWVVAMEHKKVGAATIQGALGVLRSVLEAAVDARVIRDNPARAVRAPRRDAHLDRVLSPAEDIALLEALDRQFPGRPDARLFCELMLYCGLRWEEAAALDRNHVAMRDQLVHVGPVLERDGSIRPYPKSPAGVRPVPVDDDVWTRLRDHAMTVRPGSALALPPTGLLFTSPKGGPLDYSRWHDRVWQRGLEEVIERGPKRKILATRKTVEGRVTPHDLRHTCFTRLAEQGVPPHEIMALAGHESLASVQRYLHAGAARFARAREATRRARTG